MGPDLAAQLLAPLAYPGEPVPGRGQPSIGSIFQPKLLLVEDSPSDGALIEADFQDESPNWSVHRVSTLGAAVEEIARQDYDAVLLDLGLPDSDGLDTFTELSRVAPHTAIIVVSGLNNSDTAEQAVILGAQDFVVKGTTRRGELTRVVTYAIRRHDGLEALDKVLHDQLEAKDRFLSHVSHELRSPLAVVHQFVSLLADEVAGPLTPDQRDYLEVTMRNIDQLRVLIDDLLEIGRLEGGRLVIECRPTPLGTLLGDCVRARQNVAREHSIVLTLSVEDIPSVFCDSSRTREVVDNLLDNSLKFTPDGGAVHVSAVAEGDRVRVNVRDNGPGIGTENLERVFEQFFQERRGDEPTRRGLGLGLFICRELIERQGGEIWAESTPGEWMSVTFTLPFEQAKE
jgi:signal transduction histidine kinase